MVGGIYGLDRVEWEDAVTGARSVDGVGRGYWLLRVDGDRRRMGSYYL